MKTGHAIIKRTNKPSFSVAKTSHAIINQANKLSLSTIKTLKLALIVLSIGFISNVWAYNNEIEAQYPSITIINNSTQQTLQATVIGYCGYTNCNAQLIPANDSITCTCYHNYRGADAANEFKVLINGFNGHYLCQYITSPSETEATVKANAKFCDDIIFD